jgi:signal transduction histidine kinase
LQVTVADGYGATALRGSVLPAGSLSARVIAEGKTVVVTDATGDERIWQGVIQAADAGPALFVPLGTAEDAVGTLVVTNRVGRPAFTDEMTALAESFARQAALALRLGAAAQDREQLAVLVDRDRIARDLHDLVIQRLFATGMSLEGALRGMQPAASSDRVHRAVDDLDATIKEIRTSIFALQSPAPASGEGLRSAVLQASHGAAATLGFEPQVTFEGPVDGVVPINVAEQLLAVLREALSNVARHADASGVIVTVTAAPQDVRLAVLDNGNGIQGTATHSGLANLARRARDLGGTFRAEAVAPPGKGTSLQWRVPLPEG